MPALCKEVRLNLCRTEPVPSHLLGWPRRDMPFLPVDVLGTDTLLTKLRASICAIGYYVARPCHLPSHLVEVTVFDIGRKNCPVLVVEDPRSLLCHSPLQQLKARPIFPVLFVSRPLVTTHKDHRYVGVCTPTEVLAVCLEPLKVLESDRVS